MNLDRRTTLLLLTLGGLSPRAGLAQSYPAKPIRWIIGFQAGGGSDMIARLLAEAMGKHLGQQVLVDNRPGAGGALAAGAAASSPPDGYTVVSLDFGTYVLNPHLYSKVPYNPTKDFNMVGMMVTVPLVLFVNPNAPSGSLAEFVAHVKSRPSGTVNYGSAGVGSAIHLAMELFQEKAGIRMTHVPYKGTPAALTDVISGQVTAVFCDPNTAMPHVREGRLKPLAVAMPTRLEAYPQLPTCKELGYDVEVPLWIGLGVPAATPAPVVARLSEALSMALKEPEVGRRLGSVGVSITPASSAAANSFASKQLAEWGDFLKPRNIRLD